MKNTKLFAYEDKGTVIHKLSGFTKLLCFLLLSFAAMLSFDFRVLLGISIIAIVIAKTAKFSLKRYKVVVIYLIVFMMINFLLTFLMEPLYGVEIFGTMHEVIRFSDHYILTLEELFYQLIKVVKYVGIMPLGLLFFVAIDPSEFASSLNGVKVPYKACTVVSLALRYFPDIQRDYQNISLAQQARGIDTSKKASLKSRIVNISKVLIPLVFSTLDRIELITNAMELRGYGKYKTRTWYSYRALEKRDYIAISFCLAVFVFSIVMRILVGGMYWNPFI